VLGFYYAYSDTPPLEGLLTVDASFTASSFPFPIFGALALVIFVLLAATSHDFWQRFLGAVAWKWLHMSIYAAYGLVVLHVAYGAVLGDATPFFVVPFVLSVALVVGLHLMAVRRAREAAVPRAPEGWIDAGPVRGIPKGRVLPVLRPSGERIALVRTEKGLSAIHGVCAHQGGPLWRGEVIDGCLTCPWHGWQYRPEDGCAPPPFTERIPTHQVRIVEGRVEVKDAPEAPGTALPPCPVDTDGEPPAEPEPEVSRG
jgi:nitrite reductase/ring-hydroxylating ferredoxin subunit